MSVEVVLEWILFLEKEEVVVELQQRREILDLLMMVMDCPHSVPVFSPKLDLITFHFHLIQIGFLDLSISPLPDSPSHSVIKEESHGLGPLFRNCTVSGVLSS